jgi:uncharacterized membrane protein
MVNLNRTMYYVLVAGMLSSGALYIIGIGLFVAENPSPSVSLPRFDPGNFLRDISELRPVAILALATIVLIGTPITRVFISIIVFAKNRENRFVLVTGVVFTVLMISLLVGYFFQVNLSS